MFYLHGFYQTSFGVCVCVCVCVCAHMYVCVCMCVSRQLVKQKKDTINFVFAEAYIVPRAMMVEHIARRANC